MKDLGGGDGSRRKKKSTEANLKSNTKHGILNSTLNIPLIMPIIGIKSRKEKGDVYMVLAKVELNEVHLASLDKAASILGHTSRSETLRWLALYAAQFAATEGQRVTGYGAIEEGHKRQFEEDEQKTAGEGRTKESL